MLRTLEDYAKQLTQQTKEYNKLLKMGSMQEARFYYSNVIIPLQICYKRCLWSGRTKHKTLIHGLPKDNTEPVSVYVQGNLKLK